MLPGANTKRRIAAHVAAIFAIDNNHLHFCNSLSLLKFEYLFFAFQQFGGRQ